MKKIEKGFSILQFSHLHILKEFVRMAGAWEGVGEEEYGLQWDVDRVDLDFKTGGDEDLEDGCGDCGGAVEDDHQNRVERNS